MEPGANEECGAQYTTDIATLYINQVIIWINNRGPGGLFPRKILRIRLNMREHLNTSVIAILG